MYRKSKGFSLAEILIVFLIITMVVLASASFFKRKLRSINSKTQKHGTYACTVFDEQEYYFVSSTKNAAIPVDMSGWVPGKCGTAFSMPTTGAMNVTLIGAGGNGGDATLNENSEDKDFYLDLVDGFDKIKDYSVPATGWYKIKILGDKGTQSIAKSPSGCFINTSDPGNAVQYERQLYLTENDTIKVKYNGKTIPFCYPNDKKSVEFECGLDGGYINIYQNDTLIIEVRGAEAGRFISGGDCYFAPQTGADGKVMRNGFEQPSTSNDNDGTNVSIKWDEDLNSSSTKTYTPKPGRGGEAGSLTSFLYPVLRKDLPNITIGKNNVTEVKDRATVFGVVKAQGGRDKAISYERDEVDKYDGYNGQKFENDSTVNTTQGIGGKSPNYNGTNATGFASGGGGGGVVCDDNNPPSPTACQLGKGGKGANGILIITY